MAKFLDQHKTIPFQFLSIFIGDKWKSDTLEMFVRFLGELQIISCIIQTATDYPAVHLSEFTSTIKDVFLNITLLQADYESVAVSPFLAIVGVILTLMLILIGIACLYTDDKMDSGDFLKQIVNTSILIHTNLLSLYINLTLFSLLKTSMLSTLNDLNLAGVAILIVLNNTLGAFGARFGYCKLNGPYLAGMRIADHGISSFVYKFFYVIFRCFIELYASRLMRIAISLVYLVFQGRTFSKSPFYHFKIHKIFFKIYAAQFAWVIGAMCNLALSRTEWSFFIYFSLILTLCLEKISSSLLTEQLLVVSSDSHSKRSGISNFYLKLQVAHYLIENGQNIQISKDYTLEDMLFSQAHSDIKLTQNPIEISKQLNYQMKKLFDSGIKIYQDENLNLMRAYYEISNSKHPSYLTIIELLKLKKRYHRIDVGVIANDLIKRYELNISRKTLNEESIDIKQVFDFYDSKYQFLKDIRDSTQRYIEFWRKDSIQLTITQLFEKTITFTRDANYLAQFWSRLKHIISRSNKLEALNYSLYLYFVRSAPFSSFKIIREKVFEHLNRAHEDQQGVLTRSLDDENAITFLVEVGKDGFESIIFATKSAEMLGYQLNEYHQMTVGVLFPLIYKESKTFSLLSYMERDQGSAIHKHNAMYVKSKDHSIKKFTVYTCPIPRDRKMTYLLILLPLENEDYEEIIITTEECTLDSWTEHIGKELKLQHYFEDDHDVTIHEILSISTANNSKVFNPNDLDAEPFSPVKQVQVVKSNLMSKVGHSRRLKYESRYKKLINYIPEAGKKKKMLLNNGRDVIEYKILREVFKDSNAICLKFQRISKQESINTDDMNNMFDQIDEKQGKAQKSPVKAGKHDALFSHASSEQDTSIKNLFQGPKFVKGKGGPHTIAQSISSIGMKNAEADNKLEQSIHNHKTTLADRIPNYGIIFYILLSILLMTIFLISTLKVLDKLPDVFEVSAKIYDRHFYLWEWTYYMAGFTENILKGIAIGREGMSIQQAFSYVSGAIYTWSLVQNDVGFDIKKIIPKFEPELQPRFFDTFKIKPKHDSTLNENVTLFEFDERFVDSGLIINTIKDLDYTTIPESFPEYRFITQNTFDDQYIAEESFYPIVKEDIRLKLDYLKTFCLINNIILLVIGVLLFVGIFLEEKEFMIQKTRFSEAVSRITDQEIDTQMKKVEKFVHLSENVEKLTSYFDSICKHSGIPKAKLAKEFNLKGSSRRKDPDGVNKKIYILLFAIFLMISFIIGVSFGIEDVLGRNSDDILSKVDDSIQASKIFNRLCVVTVTLFSYVAKNTTLTIKNRPYNEIWNEDMAELARMQEFYVSLLDRVDSDLASLLWDQYNTDLCNFIPAGEACIEAIHPMVKNGALSFNAYVIKNSQHLKDQFDNSNRTKEAQYEILNSDNFINMEFASYYMPNTTNTIQGILKEQVLRTINTYRRTMILTYGLYSSFFLLFLLIVWRPVWNKMREQRIMIYEMMKMIPVDIITDNVYIKTFWNKFTGVNTGAEI